MWIIKRWHEEQQDNHNVYHAHWIYLCGNSADRKWWTPYQQGARRFSDRKLAYRVADGRARVLRLREREK